MTVEVRAATEDDLTAIQAIGHATWPETYGVGNLDLHRVPPTIWKLYVLPAAQGLGAGSALLRELVRLAEGKTVTLEYVDGNDRAAAFYERQGFVEVRRQAAESAGPPETVWMERPAAEV